MKTIGTAALLIASAHASASAHEYCSDHPTRLECTSIARTFVENVDRMDPAKDVNRMLAGDLNGDGTTDLVFSAVVGGVFAILADENGTYAGQPRPISSEELLLGALADMDDNGTLDVVAYAYPGDDALLAIFANDGSGNFRSLPSPLVANMERINAILAEDLDGDNQKDLVVLGARLRDELTVENGSVEIHMRAGNSFVLGKQLPCGTANAIALGDVDADGSVDIVLETSRDDDFAPNPQSTLSLYRGDGAPKFSLVREIKVPLLDLADASRPLRMVDLDRNGTLDLLYAPRSSEDVAFVTNLGMAAFGPVERISLSEGVRYTREVEAVDLDLDGDLDLLARTSRWASLVVRAEQERLVERGTVDLWSNFHTGSFSAMVIADLNADRYPDFVTLTSDSRLSRWISAPSTNAMEAEPNSGGCACSASRPGQVSSSLYSLALWLSAGLLLCRRRVAR